MWHDDSPAATRYAERTRGQHPATSPGTPPRDALASHMLTSPRQASLEMQQIPGGSIVAGPSVGPRDPCLGARPGALPPPLRQGPPGPSSIPLRQGPAGGLPCPATTARAGEGRPCHVSMRPSPTRPVLSQPWSPTASALPAISSTLGIAGPQLHHTPTHPQPPSASRTARAPRAHAHPLHARADVAKCSHASVRIARARPRADAWFKWSKPCGLCARRGRRTRAYCVWGGQRTRAWWRVRAVKGGWGLRGPLREGGVGEPAWFWWRRQIGPRAWGASRR